jgi:sentrin-specific protease 1
MDTVLIPICKDYHWTLLVLQPKSRKIMHLDSFNKRSSHPDLARAWISDYLGELYSAQQWEVLVVRSPQQTNGYDCGVHVITNGICMALGLEPVASYCVDEMPLQRLRIAGMLLNGGLNGEFDLWKH